MDAAIVRLARRPGDQQGNQESSDPHRRSDKKGFDISIIERLDDCREEVLEVLRKERGVLQENEQIDAFISKYQRQGFFDTARARVVSLACIVQETPLGVVLLLFIQPGCGGRVVGKRETGDR